MCRFALEKLAAAEFAKKLSVSRGDFPADGDDMRRP